MTLGNLIGICPVGAKSRVEAFTRRLALIACALLTQLFRRHSA
jgi:hypothetical protein